METLCNFFWADAYLNTQGEEFSAFEYKQHGKPNANLSVTCSCVVCFYFIIGLGLHLCNQFALVQTAKFFTFYG